MSSSVASRPKPVARRAVLRAGGALGVAAALGTAVRSADADADWPLADEERAAVLGLAGAVAVIPVPFPNFGESGVATARVSADRLRAAAAKTPANRMADVHTGARTLVDAGLLKAPPRELALGVGQLVAKSGGKPTPALQALVALAISTVSAHFDPANDKAAQLWLDVVRRLATNTGGGR
jgi:hypothetical protein